MKKVININFQGRVIPIEESAFDMLKNYIDSLKRYFSNEDGKDEIINDIESRIAELFSEILKKGSTCIIESDVEKIILTMGRPEDFEAEEGYTENEKKTEQESKGPNYQYTQFAHRGRFYRNADDKIIGGVCSGLANYLGVDPVIIRIFAVVFFTAFFWIYILLMIIVPSKSIETDVTKRLFRDVENKWLGGVCSGMAAYFNVNVIIPRLLFFVPFFIWFVSGNMRNMFILHDFSAFPKLVMGSFGLGMAFIYVVLWIALPIARSTSDKLEMRGEKVDVNNIRNTVKEELESFKGRSEKFGQEMKSAADNLTKRAKEFSETVQERTKEIQHNISSKEAGSVSSFIRGFFKVFMVFIVCCMILGVFSVIVGLIFVIATFFPVQHFFISGGWQSVLFYGTIYLFFLVPLIGLVVYFVRRLSGAKPNRNLSIIFGSLWALGWVALTLFIANASRDLKSRSSEEYKVELQQPANKINLVLEGLHHYSSTPAMLELSSDLRDVRFMNDTMFVRRSTIAIIPSPNDQYGISVIKESHGRNYRQAMDNAQNIHFAVEQTGDNIKLSDYFAITEQYKYRGQNMMVLLFVPVGKTFTIDHEDYYDRRHLYAYYIDRPSSIERIRSYGYSLRIKSGEEYVMTEKSVKLLSELNEKPAEEVKPVTKEVPPPKPAAPVKDTAQVVPVTKPEPVYEYPSN